jgi:hypothetical protein
VVQTPLLYRALLHHDCTTFRRFLFKLGASRRAARIRPRADTSQSGQGSRGRTSSEASEAAIPSQGAEYRFMTQVMEVQVDHPKLSTRLG